MTRFSIVVPAYNAEATLADTLDAVRAQSFTDWECIVVDDGSSDGTASLAQAYCSQDTRFRVVTQPNQGTAGAYNTGVGFATGDYVVICSADDVLLPQHLFELSAFIQQKPEYDIYSTNGFFWTPDGARRPVYQPHEIPSELPLSRVIANCFYSVGATYRREWFARVGGYRRGIFGEDYDFWLRAMAAGAKHTYIPACLSLHRVGAAQKSADLRAVYNSDIRILTDLKQSIRLDAAATRAADETIARRWACIVRLEAEEQARSGRLKVLVLPAGIPMTIRGRGHLHPSAGANAAQARRRCRNPCEGQQSWSEAKAGGRGWYSNRAR